MKGRRATSPGSLRYDRLDQARIVVLDVADARADRPVGHLMRWVGREHRLELADVRGLPRAMPAMSQARGPPASDTLTSR
jgi:hypothetical protein